MIDFLFNTSGRISRKGYLVAFLIPYTVLTNILPKVVGGLPGVALLLSLVSLFYLWPSMVAVPVRRFHDMGASGWYQLGVLVLMGIGASIIGVELTDAYHAQEGNTGKMDFAVLQALMVEMIKENSRVQLGIGLMLVVQFAQFMLFALRRGDDGANRYGNDPLADGQGFAD